MAKRKPTKRKPKQERYVVAYDSITMGGEILASGVSDFRSAKKAYEARRGFQGIAIYRLVRVKG